MRDGHVEAPFPERFGFRSGARGTQTSRTIMLAELRALLDATPAGASKAEYRAAIVESNVLGKKTAATRRLTAQRLGELYGLDPDVTLFRLLRVFWDAEPEGRPLLALLCAAARDPLLRLTAGPILKTPPWGQLAPATLAEAVAEAFPDRFNPATLHKIARNAASSWTQSGHLTGRGSKRRGRPVVTAGATAYALALGYLTGVRGSLLLNTFWTKLLDAPAERITALAVEASRRNWLNYRQAGSVIEVRFPGLLTAAEEEALRGED